MTPSRHYFDPLQTSKDPRWLVVSDRAGQQLSSRRIEPGTDLRGVLDAERQQFERDGWRIEEWPIRRHS